MLYTATQVPFNVQVTDGLIDLAVLDRGPGNPPENAAIKGIAILGRPNPAAKYATRPRIVSATRDGGQFSVRVDPQANLARYLCQSEIRGAKFETDSKSMHRRFCEVLVSPEQVVDV